MTEAMERRLASVILSIVGNLSLCLCTIDYLLVVFPVVFSSDEYGL